MAGLAVVLEHASPSLCHADDRAGGFRFLCQRLGLPDFMVERRQSIRGTGMVAGRQIAHEQVGLITGDFRAPMPHFLHRRLPARTRQTLLSDEIRAVAYGTARNDQSFRAWTQ